MSQSYKPYVPQTIGELYDLVGAFMLRPPTQADPYFPGRNVETEFFALNEGLARVRKRLGEERYAKLLELSHRMRQHFEADPDDTNGEARKGYMLIHEMDALLVKPPR
jgi:hypothetical protein